MNRKTSIPFLIILWVGIFMQSIYAASFHHLNLENGLSSRQVFQICKDSTGFVWMFTHLGVDRYDGNEFRHYKLDETLDAKDHILSSTIMTCDPDGRIWISLKNGNLFRYETLTDNFIPQTQITTHFTGEPTINDIFFDQKKRLWLCLSNGLYYYDEGQGKLKSHSDFHNEHITRIIQIPSGEYFVGTDTGIYRFTETTSQQLSTPILFLVPWEMRVESFHYEGHKLYIGTFSNSAFIFDNKTESFRSLNEIVPSAPVRSIISVGKEIWIGTDGSGIYCIDSTNDQFIKRYNADEDNRNSLGGNTVSDLMIDERQCVWVSTYSNGVSIFEPEFPEIKWTAHEQSSRQSLISNHVNVIMEDADGDIWYGTNNGISLYQPHSDRWTHFLEDKGKNSDRSNVVLALCEDNRGRVWTGGYGIGIYCIDKHTGKTERVNIRGEETESPAYSADYIYSIYAEGDYIWLGGIEGEFTRYHTRTHRITRYPIDCIGDIKAGQGNNLLLAGCSGLAFFNKSDGGTLWHREFDKTTLRYPVRCLLQASNRIIWLATDGEGLISFDLTSNTSRFYTTENGLSSNSINGVVEDLNGEIWFTTEKNLYKLDKETGLVLSMNEFIGVEWGSYNSNACIRKKNGNLAFGTAEGVVEFSPNFDTYSDEKVQLLLTDFKLLYETVQPGEKDSPLKVAINHTSSIDLQYVQNSFSLFFSAINFTHPHQIEYYYKLNGFDKEWRSTTSSHHVDYMNLSPGGNILSN